MIERVLENVRLSRWAAILPRQAGQVGQLSVNRSVVYLEISGVDDHPLRRGNRKGAAVHNGMRHAQTDLAGWFSRLEGGTPALRSWRHRLGSSPDLGISRLPRSQFLLDDAFGRK